jgi:transcriptional regulator with XRE-family HTH domain
LAARQRPHLIKDLLLTRGWSLSELARRSNLSKQDLSRITRGQSIAWPAWRKRIARALKVPEGAVIWSRTTEGRVGIN